MGTRVPVASSLSSSADGVFHSYSFLVTQTEEIPLQQEGEGMKVLNARGKAAHTLGTRRQAGASPAGKNLASSVSAPFCFRAFRPGPRFSFLVGSNLRPMILGKRKTGVSRRVGKGTAARRLSVSEWEGASSPPEPRLGTPTAPRGLTKLLPRRDPAPRHLYRVPSSRPSPGQGSLPRLPPESSEASAHLKAGPGPRRALGTRGRDPRAV